jgi:hypothetical protein
MSSDWELHEEGGEQWYENTVTGETAWELPESNYDFNAADAGATGGGASGYGADEGTAWEEDTTANYEWHGDDATGEWGETAHYDGSKQVGLYDFNQTQDTASALAASGAIIQGGGGGGYFGEDGMWYEDDNDGDESKETGEEGQGGKAGKKKGNKKKNKPKFEAPSMNFGWGKKSKEEQEAKRIADEEAAAAAAEGVGEYDGTAIEPLPLLLSHEEGDGDGGYQEPYQDENGEWVVPGAAEEAGYYDESGEWVDTATGAALGETGNQEDEEGHYDETTGEWMADGNNNPVEGEISSVVGGGEETGYYDDTTGEWMDTTAGGDGEGGGAGENAVVEWNNANADDTGDGTAVGEGGGYYDEETGTWFPDEAQNNEETGGGEEEWMDQDGNVYGEEDGEDLGDGDDAGGYYDEDTGEWVETTDAADAGEETGYYDEDTGEWMDADGNVYGGEGDGESVGGEEEEVDESGYAEEGYYDDFGNWVNGPLPDAETWGGEEEGFDDGGGGYYDESGEWVGGVGGGGVISVVEEELEEGASEDAGWYIDNATGDWVELPAGLEKNGGQGGAMVVVDGDDSNYNEPPAAAGLDGGGGGDGTSGSVVVTVLRASGLPPFRVKEAEDTYERLVITDYLRKSSPYMCLGFASLSEDPEKDAVGRTPAGVGSKPDWVKKAEGGGSPPPNNGGASNGGPNTGESDPNCRFELFIPDLKAAKDVMVEVWDEAPDGPKLFYGRAMLPREAVVQAMSFSYEDGGAGTTVTIPLKDRPFTIERTAKGDVTLRIDPQGAPPATGMSDDEAALAALAAFDPNAALLEEMEESERIAAAEAAAAAADGQDEDSLADSNNKDGEEGGNGGEEGGEGGEDDPARGPAPPPPKNLMEASAKEMRWPVSDVYAADALRNYLDLLEDAEFSDKDRRKYDAFMREPKGWGQVGVREGSLSWEERDRNTKQALRQALRQGKSVVEAEQLVLTQMGTWHDDVAHGDISAIPLASSHVVGLEKSATSFALSSSSSSGQQKGGGDDDGTNRLLAAQQPYATPLVHPHVLDSPRTLAQKVEAANNVLLAGGAVDVNGKFVSGEKLEQKRARLSALGLDPNDANKGGVGGGGCGASGTSLLTSDIGGSSSGPMVAIQAGGGSSSSSSSTSRNSVSLALPPPSSSSPPPPSLVPSMCRQMREEAAPVVLDGLGVALDAQLPGLRADAAYPWQRLTKMDDENPLKEVKVLVVVMGIEKH